jgi:hypothetical protein
MQKKQHFGLSKLKVGFTPPSGGPGRLSSVLDVVPMSHLLPACLFHGVTQASTSRLTSCQLSNPGRIEHI